MERTGSPEQQQRTINALHTETGEQLSLAPGEYEQIISREVPRGVYRHFKSTLDDHRIYEVTDTIRVRETREELAIYTSGTANYARPIEMFVEPVAHGGDYIRRFTYLGKNNTSRLCT